MQTNYPEAINEWLEKVHSSLIQSEFYLENDIDPTIGKASLVSQAGAAALKSWVESGEIRISEDSMIDILHMVMVESTLRSLQEKGVIGSLDDNQGDEVFYITEAGKSIMKEYNETEAKGIAE